MKVIEVARCGVDECPLCIPHSTKNNVNYCGGFVNNQPEVSADLKTFPSICPLTEDKDFYTNMHNKYRSQK